MRCWCGAQQLALVVATGRIGFFFLVSLAKVIYRPAIEELKHDKRFLSQDVGARMVLLLYGCSYAASFVPFDD